MWPLYKMENDLNIQFKNSFINFFKTINLKCMVLHDMVWHEGLNKDSMALYRDGVACFYPPSSPFPRNRNHFKWYHWLIDWIEFYVVSAIFQPIGKLNASEYHSFQLTWALDKTLPTRFKWLKNVKVGIICIICRFHKI